MRKVEVEKFMRSVVYKEHSMSLRKIIPHALCIIFVVEVKKTTKRQAFLSCNYAGFVV